MVAEAIESPRHPPIPADKTAQGHVTQSALSKVARLKNALFVEDFAVSALKDMRECLSFDDPESARDNALAFASAVKSWDTAQERIRILKGEPQPGQKRPLPEAPKVVKRKLNRPPPEPGQRPPTPQGPTA